MHKFNYDISDICMVTGFPPINSNHYKMNLKTELKSFLITFAVSMVLVILPEINNITPESFKDGALLGVLFGALRAGLKAVLELFVIKFSSK